MLRSLRLPDFGAWNPAILAALALIVAALLYPRPQSDVPADGSVTEIVYWNIPGPFGEAVRPALEEFERRNPQYKVVYGTATAADTVGDPTRFLLSVAGDVPPDLMFFDRFAIVEWASRGAFIDLTPYIDRDRDKEFGVRQEDYIPAAWNEAVYEGKNYAIATAADTRALYYAHEPLRRAGLVYTADDPDVVAGKASVGEARPPKTWEDLCRKRLHATGSASADGLVTLSDFQRMPMVNVDVPADARPDLAAAGVRVGDVVTLGKGSTIFRARIDEIVGSNALRVNFMRELPPGTSSVPSALREGIEIKVFDQDSYEIKLTRFQPSGELGDVGFVPFLGNNWLYLYAFANKAEFMSADGREVRLDSPEIVQALQWLTDINDCLGGADKVSAVQQSAGAGALHPFITGKVALIIDLDMFMQNIMAYRPDMPFGVVPAPIPEQRMKEGFQPVGWGGGEAHAIPSTARHKDAAWELLKWLNSLEANKIIAEADASLRRAKGQTYFPRLHAHMGVMKWYRERFIAGNPAIPPTLVKAYDTYATLLPRSRHRPVTPVGQTLWSEHVRATETGTNHKATPYEALNYGKRRVQAELDRVLHPPTGPLVPWTLLVGLYVGAVLLAFAAIILLQVRHLAGTRTNKGRWIEGYICASPWLLGFIAFGLGPIIFSIIISFCHYDVLNPARFIGFGNYTQLLGRHYDPLIEKTVWSDPLFWRSLGNTAFMIIGVPLGLVVGLGMAMMLDLEIRGRNIYRTVFYLPSVMPAVAGFILWLWVFDPTLGMLNQALRLLGFTNLPTWLLDPNWSKPSLILMSLWGVGASMIIWLAGLKDIPQSYYEAAAVDGANPIQRFFNVTLPLLSPYILFNTIMAMIGVFQIFEAAFIMTEGGPADSTLFFAYKLFNEAFRYLDMGTASAMAWILFTVVLVATLFQLWLSKHFVHYGN